MATQKAKGKNNFRNNGFITSTATTNMMHHLHTKPQLEHRHIITIIAVVIFVAINAIAVIIIMLVIISTITSSVWFGKVPPFVVVTSTLVFN